MRHNRHLVNYGYPLYARNHFSQRHGTPIFWWLHPSILPFPLGLSLRVRTGWCLPTKHLIPQPSGVQGMSSQPLLLNRGTGGYKGGGAKCVSVCCTISSSKWFLRGGEGALRDGRDDLFCFPPFPLLTTSWRCLVNFLHWKGRNTPTPHFHIANSSPPPAILPHHNPCSHTSLPTLTPRALFAEQTFDHFLLPLHHKSAE